MRRMIATALLLAGLLCLFEQPSRTQDLTLVGAGAPKAAGGAAYVGPGDVVASAIHWYGLRAYSSAYAAGSFLAATIIRASDSTTANISVLPTGAFDVATAGTFCASTTCKFTALFDQSGHNWTLTQATDANRPALTFNCIGSLPCMTFSGGQSLSSGNSQSCPNGTTTVAQPFTVSTVAKRSGALTSESVIWDCHSTPNALVAGFNASANNAEMFAGSVKAAAATNSAQHAFQFLFNGASSNLVVDGTTNIVSPGTQGITNNAGVFIGASDSGAVPLTGTINEVGTWGSGFSAGNISSMNSNQHTYWGF